MRQRSNPLSERNIKRIDTKPGSVKQTHGFQVCISKNGALHTKHFSDSVCGGTKNALKAARSYRDQFLADMPPLEASRIAHTANVKNKSGHVGISYRSYKTTKGKKVNLLTASVRAEKGRTVSKVFRYTKEDHGSVLQEALAYREAILAQRLKREGGVRGIMKANSVAEVPELYVNGKSIPIKKALSKKIAAKTKVSPAKSAKKATKVAKKATKKAKR
jgi:hypothetical protein